MRWTLDRLVSQNSEAGLGRIEVNTIFAALVFLPFILWHVYRASRAIKRGVFESFGDPVDRTLQPAIFWFRVIRQLLLALLLVGGAVSAILRPDTQMLMWLLATWVVIYVAIGLVTALRLRARSNEPLERAGCAGRSAARR